MNKKNIKKNSVKKNFVKSVCAVMCMVTLAFPFAPLASMEAKAVTNVSTATCWSDLNDGTVKRSDLDLLSGVFIPAYYAWYNPDLLEAGLVTDKQLLDHWLTYGIYEGRKCRRFVDIPYIIEHNPGLTAEILSSHIDELIDQFVYENKVSWISVSNDKSITRQYIKDLLRYDPNIKDPRYVYTIYTLLTFQVDVYGVYGPADKFVEAAPADGYECFFPRRASDNPLWQDINRFISSSIKQTDWMEKCLGIYPTESANSTVHLTTEIAAKSGHNYYGGLGLTQQQINEADIWCYTIAEEVLTNPNYANYTDLQRIDVAAQMVAYRCRQITYGSDARKYYRSPYGVFISGNYTCAGATRAMGRILEFMGIEWAHVNENENCHQWCVFYLNGQLHCADGMAGYADKGIGLASRRMPNGMVVIPLANHANYHF